MAASNSVVAESEALKDGPVLTMMSKRLRSLKKKYNRILQIEENRALGKAINKEQEDVLKTKTAVAALIDEYEKLRQPLSAAVQEEVAQREKELLATPLQRREEEGSVADEKDLELMNSAEKKDALSEEVRKDMDDEAPVLCNGTSQEEALQENNDEEGHSLSEDAAIADLLKLLYFAHLFDVRSHREAASLVWTKVHERSSCLSYDFVTDDSTTPLLEGDLDTLALFGSLLTSRSPNATLSHKEALQLCIQHATLWLQNSDRPIQPDAGITYSHLKERLNRILSSEYYTMTPELQTVSQQTAAIAATAAGQYVTEVLVQKVSAGSTILDTDKFSTLYSHEDDADSAGQLTPNEEPVSLAPLEAASDTSPPDSHASVDSSPTHGAESPKLAEEDDETITENEDALQKTEHMQLQDPMTSAQYLTQEQQQQQPNVFQTVGPRGYQGFRGRGMGYGASGRGRSYGARGRGRGGRGYYGNGRGGQYFDQGGYSQRNYYGRGGGRGGRGGMMFNGNGPMGGAVIAGSN